MICFWGNATHAHPIYQHPFLKEAQGASGETWERGFKLQLYFFHLSNFAFFCQVEFRGVF